MGGAPPSGTSPSHFAVPPDNRSGRIPGLSVFVDRSPVVQDPPVHRPGPGVVREYSDCLLHRCLLQACPLHPVPVLVGEAAGIKPVQGRCRTVSGKVAKTGEQFAFFLPADKLAVYPFRHRSASYFFIPVQVNDRLLELPPSSSYRSITSFMISIMIWPIALELPRGSVAW